MNKVLISIFRYSQKLIVSIFLSKRAYDYDYMWLMIQYLEDMQSEWIQFLLLLLNENTLTMLLKE
jgi:hypothetical protein